MRASRRIGFAAAPEDEASPASRRFPRSAVARPRPIAVPRPHHLRLDEALREAHRALRPGGQLVVFDADYASTTVALAAADPLQACATATVESIVHDPHLVPKLASRIRNAGFTIRSFRSYGYHGVLDADYILTIVDRGAEALANAGRIGSALATALKDEARRRVEVGTFFGHLAYASVIATR